MLGSADNDTQTSRAGPDRAVLDGREALRILIVSFVFPPYNVIGAVRVGKTAKYLRRLGHDVRVLAARDIGEPQTLALEIPEPDVVYTDWYDVDAPYRRAMSIRAATTKRIRKLLGGAGENAAAGVSGGDAGKRGSVQAPGARRSMWRYVRLAYADLLHLPDSAVGWYRPAMRAGRALIARWRPDVILASGAPWTGFLVARDLARQAQVPWVADLRDPWVGNPDLHVSKLRKRLIDPWYERRVLASASALVTVTEPIAALIRRRHPDKPVHVVLNGYDPEDYQSADRTQLSGDSAKNGDSRRADRSGEAVLRLGYTGQMYRDLTPLLDALALLGPDQRSVKVEILGVSDAAVRAEHTAAAAARGIADSLIWLAPVSHREALRFQQSADVLFLLVHDTPYDAGIYTGKLLEYIAARRPILVVGTAAGLAADLVRTRRMGAAERTPERIAARILDWLQEKRRTGVVAAPPSDSLTEFSRDTQTRAFARILTEAVSRI